MDWLQFISTIIVGLAWPSVLIVLLVIIRKQISALAERIEEASFGGGKVKFEKVIGDARRHVERIDPEVQAAEARKPIAGPDDPFLKLANQFPEAAVLEAYRKVEATLWEMVMYLGLPTNTRDAWSVINTLHREGYIDENTTSLFKNLQTARNQAVHGRANVSPGEALEYRTQARSLIEVLHRAFDRWQRNPDNKDRPFPAFSNSPTLQEKRRIAGNAGGDTAAANEGDSR